MPPFHCEGHLATDSPESLGAGETVPFPESSQLSFLVGGHDDDLVYSFVDGGFEEQGNIIHDNGIAISPDSSLRQSDLLARDAGMDNSFQSPEFCPIMKHGLAKALPVDRSVGIEHGFPESANDVSPGRFAGFDDLSRQFVGIDHDCAARPEHVRDGTFSGGEASRESNQDHGGAAYHASHPTGNCN